MSILVLGFIACVVLLLILVGIIIGWTIGTNDSQVEILSRRLHADQQIAAMTRETLHAMRDAVRRRA